MTSLDTVIPEQFGEPTIYEIIVSNFENVEEPLEYDIGTTVFGNGTEYEPIKLDGAGPYIKASLITMMHYELTDG